jgi:putative SOS response-associated peptidase YedK
MALPYPPLGICRSRRAERRKDPHVVQRDGGTDFRLGGLWRVSDEWGPVHSGVMTDCNEAIRPVHDRMPVLLQPDEYDHWLNGTFDDVMAFQARCFPDELIETTRTRELWVKRKAPPTVEGLALS